MEKPTSDYDVIKATILGVIVGGVVIGAILNNVIYTNQENVNITVQADRACRPGIYKRVLESDNRVICIGGNNEEWIVPLNK